MSKTIQPQNSDKPESEPWSAIISQAELAQFPGEMGARKMTVKAIRKADQARIKAETAATHSGTRYS